MAKTTSYRESLMDALSDPAEAVAYLNAGLEDSLPSFLKALKNVTQAHQMTKIAKESGMQRETLYRSLSELGNPTLQTLTSILAAVGLQIKVEAMSAEHSGLTDHAPTVVAKSTLKKAHVTHRKQVNNMQAGKRPMSKKNWKDGSRGSVAKRVEAPSS